RVLAAADQGRAHPLLWWGHGLVRRAPTGREHVVLGRLAPAATGGLRRRADRRGWGLVLRHLRCGVKALGGVAHGGALGLLGSPWLAVVLASGMLAQYVSARSLQSGDAISVTALTGLAVN